MLDMGFFEVSLVFVVALLVLGPKRLPIVARRLGKVIRKYQKLWRNLQEEVSDPADNQRPKNE